MASLLRSVSVRCRCDSDEKAHLFGLLHRACPNVHGIAYLVSMLKTQEPIVAFPVV